MEKLDYALILNLPEECVSYNVSLSSKTWIHRGGMVAVWFAPKNVDDLVKIGRFLYAKKATFDVIGHTSNMYFCDSYNVDFVIDTREIKAFVYQGKQIICDCGAPLRLVARKCIERGVSGYEGFYNIPGTVAGGVVDNSGCYGSQMDDLVLSIDLLTPDGTVVKLTNKELAYSIRSSALKRKEIEGIVLRVYMDASRLGDAEILRQKGEYNQMLRKYEHEGPAYNLGSVFVYSWKYKKNMRNLFVRIIARAMFKLRINYLTRQRVVKWMLMLLYGYVELNKCVSDKNLKCFLWRTKDADALFPKFVSFFYAFADNPKIEIDIKE